ncbi:hypothetical protein QBC39DRAFT_348285 [Podospora conica]|nr:hypothetical protein QBC39DRAFT_348285 [Schizothecium conicum]
MLQEEGIGSRMALGTSKRARFTLVGSGVLWTLAFPPMMGTCHDEGRGSSMALGASKRPPFTLVGPGVLLTLVRVVWLMGMNQVVAEGSEEGLGSAMAAAADREAVARKVVMVARTSILPWERR